LAHGRPDYERRPNIRGDWQCSGYGGCGRWLGAYAFATRRGKPCTLCRECDAQRARRWRHERASDEVWCEAERRRWKSELRQHRKNRTRKELAMRRREVAGNIRAMLDGGWRMHRIARETGADVRSVKARLDGSVKVIRRDVYRKTVEAYRRFRAEQVGG
jgi:hypothetical protein